MGIKMIEERREMTNTRTVIATEKEREVERGIVIGIEEEVGIEIMEEREKEREIEEEREREVEKETD